MAVIEMLEAIHRDGDDGTRFVEAAKSGARSKRLMGFGHRVYKNYDPRAKILREASKSLFASMHISDPVLDIALKLEEIAAHDEYFIHFLSFRISVRWIIDMDQSQCGIERLSPSPTRSALLSVHAARDPSAPQFSDILGDDSGTVPGGC
jgi:citrate synthase